MTAPARPDANVLSVPQPAERSPEQDALARAAAAWVGQLARTLKTCRLYDAANPTVTRFRAELYAGLEQLLATHGPLTLHFRSDDVLCEETSLYPARSREDNLGLLFYHDGIHTMRLSAGITPRELDVLLDAVLHVGGPHAGDDDLVTLLWQAQLPHIEIDYVPADGDVGGSEGADEGALVPWPTPAAEPETAEADANEKPAAGTSRSDDWSTGDLSVEVEAAFEELEALAGSEVARLRQEYEDEHAVPLVTAAVALAHAWLASGTTPEQATELGALLPRVLQIALTEGRWDEAGVCAQLLGAHMKDVRERTIQELLQPISVQTAVQQIDAQNGESVPGAVRFARALGDPGLDWLNLLLGESQHRRVRRLLVEAITQWCMDRPERLAPWLVDPRWFVVRNVVHILGCIGSDATATLLATASRHPEPRVRSEVVAALGQLSPRVARPLLLRMLDGADPRTFGAVLHQLSLARDGGVARRCLALMRDPAFEARPMEEKRAVWNAVGGAATDDELAELEQELYRANWFNRAGEVNRLAIARGIARIGTPLAIAVLQRGADSRRASVRRACQDALAAPTRAAA